MTILSIEQTIRELQVFPVLINDGNLYVGSPDMLSDDLVESIKHWKPHLLEYYRQRSTANAYADSGDADLERRAAVLREYCVEPLEAQP